MTRDKDRSPHGKSRYLNERAVSEVIGSILVFGLVVALISTVQLQAIPDANSEVEFEHSQSVQSDFANVEVAIAETVETGRAQEVSYQLGVSYPPRLVFYNPPSVRGSMRTTSAPDIEIRNIDTGDSPQQYLNDKTNPNFLSLPTRTLAYTVDYNEQPAFEIIREPAASYEQQSGGTNIRRTVRVQGQTISIVAVGGDMQVGAVTAENIETEPISTPDASYSFSAAGGSPITIRVPTRLGLSASEWEQQFSQQLVSNGGNIQDVRLDSAPGDYQYLVLELQTGKEYDIRLSKVGFGTVSDTEPQYIVPVESEFGTATIEVRDKYNNPVSGVEVDYSVQGASRSGTVTTGPDGQASIEQTSGGDSVVFEKDFDGSGLDSFEEAEAVFNDDIVLTDATGFSGQSKFNITVNNPGNSREIVSVQVHHITEYDTANTATIDNDSSDLDAVPPDIEVEDFTSTLIRDGPNEVTAIAIGSTNQPLSAAAVENGAPQSLTPVLLPAGTSSIEFQTSSSYAFNTGPEDALAARVTLYFDDGSKETFDVVLQASDDS